MNVELWWMIFGALVAGLGLGVVMAWSARRSQVLAAEQQAQDLISSVQEQIQMEEAEAQEAIEEYRSELESRLEVETRKNIERIEELKAKIETSELHLVEDFKEDEELLEKKRSLVQSLLDRIKHREARMLQQKDRLRELKDQYRQVLGQSASVNERELIEQLKVKIENDEKSRINRDLSLQQEEFQLDLERQARRLIQGVINRFARPYCPERGIGLIHFSSAEAMEKTLGPNRENLKKIEQLCGVDISINNDYLSAQVLGFDPVRRELGRASLEKFAKDKDPKLEKIESLVQKVKKDLYRKIETDGKKIAQELRLPDLHPEVRRMMGALRYRYSFAQNQHFHCAEVGWLCGLLSAELGLSVADGRRAGMLHDIGKSMDHSIDGGHAVIGADFIEKHGEKPEIVHAVRAHHHDEPPSTDLAFLVIAADAISGARPGARRSTADSYSQKMAGLEKIGSSFKGVVSTYILSAGRELRVVVNSNQVDDRKALDLSRQIAEKIEEELSYPGLIKVTVVRETQAVEYAR